MRAGAVEHHAADGTQKDTQRAHSDDGNQDGVQCIQHVPCSTDLFVLLSLGEIGDVHSYRRDMKSRILFIDKEDYLCKDVN